MITYKFDVDRISDAGNGREVNEDSYLVLRHDAMVNSCVLVAVADGVGGLAHGEIASSMAVEALEKWWEKIDWTAMPRLDDLMASMTGAMKGTNNDIFHLNTKDASKSGTTLTVLLLSEDGYRIFHVGDSRVYRIGKGMFGNIEQLTIDHSQRMPKVVDGATIMKTYLTECLGYKPQFEHQELAGTHRPGELFLVCTDGIYKTIGEKDIGKIVRRKKNKVHKACYDLISQAKKNGERDNLTAAVVRIIN